MSVESASPSDRRATPDQAADGLSDPSTRAARGGVSAASVGFLAALTGGGLVLTITAVVVVAQRSAALAWWWVAVGVSLGCGVLSAAETVRAGLRRQRYLRTARALIEALRSPGPSPVSELRVRMANKYFAQLLETGDIDLALTLEDAALRRGIKLQAVHGGP
jgi:hypothetical protein